MTTALAETADRFRALHRPGHPLVLANAWDAGSAAVIAAAGAPAVATSSAGVAWSLGRPDADVLTREEGLAALARITGVVDVPVTADVESGYAEDVAGVGETITGVLAAGGVGVNLEDGARDPQEAAQRIAAARAAADAAGVPLFVNARTDVFLRGIGPQGRRVDEAVARARAYLDAGASGVFVPGVVDVETVGALAARIDAPLNVLVGPGAPSVAELAAVGVARVSLGDGVAAAAYARARAATREALTSGTYAALADVVDYGELNGLLGRSA